MNNQRLLCRVYFKDGKIETRPAAAGRIVFVTDVNFTTGVNSVQDSIVKSGEETDVLVIPNSSVRYVQFFKGVFVEKAKKRERQT